MEGLLSALFLGITTLSYLVVATLASRGVMSKENYLLGDRQFSIRSITLTLIATQVGAGMIFGTAAESYQKGLTGIAYVLGMAMGLIILGLGVGARLRSLEISTTAELFETKYNSRTMRQFASFISILTMGGIFAAQIAASRQLFASMFNLSPAILVIFWVLIIGYTTFGGLKAIIATDILQVILIVLAFVGVFFYIVPMNKIGTLLQSSPLSFDGPLFGGGFFSAMLAPIFFSLIEQDLAQRCFAAKTKRVATISAFLAAAFLLVFALIPVGLGMYAKASGIIFAPGQSPLVLLFQSKLSTLGMTIIACALLAAICSTADSLLGAASTNLIADFLPKNGTFSLAWARIITFLVGLAALATAFFFNDVIAIIVKSYEISICALFIPLMIAMYKEKPSKCGAQLSVALGVITYLALNLTTNAFSPTLVALMISGAGFLLGAFAESKFATYSTQKAKSK